jgi:hypothetical protein
MTGWTYFQWRNYNDARMRELKVVFPYYCREVLDLSLAAVMTEAPVKGPAGILVDWNTPISKDLGIMLSVEYIAAEQEHLDKLYARVQVCQTVWEEVNTPGFQPRYEWEIPQAEQAMQLTVWAYAQAYKELVWVFTFLSEEEDFWL